MEQDLSLWLRAAKCRVDLSGEKVVITAFASESALTVNASGADLAEAVASCRKKVETSEQAKAAARALFTKAVERSYHLILDKEGVEAATKGIAAARKNLATEAAFLEEADSAFRILAANTAALAERLKMAPSDEETKAGLESSSQKFEAAKEKLRSVTSRHEAAKKALEDAEAKKAALIRGAKERARLVGDAKKYKEYLMIMGAWDDGE